MFVDDLEGLKEEMESVFGVWEDGEGEGERGMGELGTLQDAVEVSEETAEVASGVWASVKAVKVRSAVCG